MACKSVDDNNGICDAAKCSFRRITMIEIMLSLASNNQVLMIPDGRLKPRRRLRRGRKIATTYSTLRKESRLGR